MKKSEIAMIVLVAGISVIIAYFAAGALIGSPSKEDARVRTATEITDEIKQPDPKIFNSEAINPTVEVNIGDK